MSVKKQALRQARKFKRKLSKLVSSNQKPTRVEPTRPGRAEVQQLFLHIGSHKTGSTYLQRLLHTHRATLRENGLFFPAYDQSLNYNENRATPAATSGHSAICRGINSEATRASALRRLDGYIAESGCRNLLLSSELMFGGRAVTVAKALRECYPSASVTIIAFLRRQDAFIESLYKERLRWKSNNVKTDIHGYMDMQGADFFDYRLRLAEVLEYDGARLVLMPYDDVLASGSLKQSFQEVIDCKGLDLEDPSADMVHNSIDNRLTNLFALINDNLPMNKQQRVLLTRILSSADLGKDRSSLLDWDTRQLIRDRYAQSNRLLASDRFSMDAPIFNFDENFVSIPRTAQLWNIEKTTAYLELFEQPQETGD